MSMKNFNETNSTKVGGVIFQKAVICICLENQMNMQVLPFYGCHPSDLLIPWSRVLLEKLSVNFAASQEIPLIYGTRNFLTVPTSARHLSPS
jgi:hypothetical protein